MYLENRFIEISFYNIKNKTNYEPIPIFLFNIMLNDDFYFRLPQFQENNKNRRKYLLIYFNFFKKYYLHLKIKLWKLG